MAATPVRGGKNVGCSGHPARLPLRATHAVAAIMAEITIAVAYGDGTTVVTTGGITLEPSELLAPHRRGLPGGFEIHLGPGQLQSIRADGGRSLGPVLTVSAVRRFGMAVPVTRTVLVR